MDLVLPDGKMLFYNCEMYYQINNRVALYSDIQNILNQAYTVNNKPYIVGQFTLLHSSSYTTININLGFMPTFMLIGVNFGLFSTDTSDTARVANNCLFTVYSQFSSTPPSPSQYSNKFYIVSNGFNVYYYNTNSNFTYQYIAFK